MHSHQLVGKTKMGSPSRKKSTLVLGKMWAATQTATRCRYSSWLFKNKQKPSPLRWVDRVQSKKILYFCFLPTPVIRAALLTSRTGALKRMESKVFLHEAFASAEGEEPTVHNQALPNPAHNVIIYVPLRSTGQSVMVVVSDIVCLHSNPAFTIHRIFWGNLTSILIYF